ncbi:MAG TPA: hypothetical protein VFY23_00195 [Candidatus Limnocylindrales bacterium]|nr:hypothetical protein [Candidatus Limnocylindrales bacterium]
MTNARLRSRLALLWPGIALTMTMFDDLVAGPVLAVGGAILGPWLGIPTAIGVFGLLVVGLAWSALMASRQLAPSVQARIDEMVRRAAGRRVVGRFVRQVGDDHLVATAVVAAVISPVFAVLLARVVHPRQRLGRTVAVAAAAYTMAFGLTYAAGGSLVGSVLA